MKKLYGNIVIIFVLILSILLVGCGEITPSKKEYDEANYTLNATFTFEKELTVVFSCCFNKHFCISASFQLSPQKSYGAVQTKDCHNTDMIELIFGGFTLEMKGSETPADKKH